MKSSKNIMLPNHPSAKKDDHKNQNLHMAFKQQQNINEFIDNLNEKTQATIYKQKLRIKAYNLNDIRQLEEIKQKVEKLRKLQQENTGMQKRKEELDTIQQGIEDTKQFNQTLQKNLDELIERKSKQDQYQLYLNQQVEQRKDLYKKINQRNLKVKQQVQFYKEQIQHFQRKCKETEMESFKNSLLNKSFSERMTTEKQSNFKSSEILHQITDTPLLDTLMKNNSQMKKFGLSNISEENQTNLLANIQNLMNQNDTNNSLSSNNMDNISQILLKQSNYIGRESRTNTLGISSDNIFQHTNQFQYQQEQNYLRDKQELDAINFQNNFYRKQLYRKFQDFYDFQNLYQQCLEYFQNNFVKSSQVQGNNQVHKSLLYQLSRNKQNQKDKQKMQFQEYYKPIKNINQTIQIQNILSSSLKTANLKIQQQQKPNKEKKIQIDWEIFKQFKANQLMAILQLHTDLLDEFNNSAEQKKRDVNQLVSRFQGIRST